MNICEYIVNKYNSEHKTSLSLKEVSRFQLPRIEAENDVISISRCTPVQLILYSYGNPYLFHLYRLLYALLEHRYYDVCIELYPIFIKEFNVTKHSIDHCLSQNPEWIITHLSFITLHELAHYNMSYDMTYKQEQLAICKKQLKSKSFLRGNNYFVKLFYRINLHKITKQDEWLEEFAADRIAFNELLSIIFQKDYNTTRNAIICASCIGSAYFLEYAARIERLYLNPTNSNNFKRIYNNIQREFRHSIYGRTRILLLDNYIRNFWEVYPINDKQNLYRSLLLPVVENFNEKINVQLHTFVTPYHKVLRAGGNVDFSIEKKIDIEQKMYKFNNSLLETLNKSISKKGLIYSV